MAEENQTLVTEATEPVVSTITDAKNGSKLKRYRKFFAIAGVLVFAVVGATTLRGVFAATTSISETFASSASNFTTVVGGNWAVSGGVYRLTNPTNPSSSAFGNANYSIHKTPITGDFTEKVDFTVTDTSNDFNDASVIFDWVDANNYYYASFNSTANSSTNGIFKIAGGVQTQLAPFTQTFPASVLRHAVVTRNNATISVSIGSAVVGSTTDTKQPGSGRLGIGSRNDTVTFDNFIVTVPGDTQAPTTPAGLKVTSSTASSISLSWTASTDNVGVTGYQIYRGSVQVGTTTSTSYTSTGLTANTSYSYSVAAIDAAANLSAKSAVVTGKTVPPAATQLLNTTFDSFPTGTISVANFRTAMGDPNFTVGASNLVHTSIISASGHGNVMRQVLPAGGVGGGSGLVVFPKLSQSVDEASIQYDVRFASNFEWGWGGKLPGLGGASGSTTPGTAAGCAAGVSSAWSGRGMWITPGSYGSVTGKNEFIGYMYNFNKKDTCGDNQRTGKAFVAGQWHTVKQYYKMNTPGQANGVHKMWFDGVQVINNTTFVYRNNTDLHINYIFWANFRGGSTSSWATPHDGIIDYDNLLVTKP